MSPKDRQDFELMAGAEMWDQAIEWAWETTWAPQIILEKKPPTPPACEPPPPPLTMPGQASVVLSRWQQAAIGQPPQQLSAWREVARGRVQCRSLAFLAQTLADRMVVGLRGRTAAFASSHGERVVVLVEPTGAALQEADELVAA